MPAAAPVWTIVVAAGNGTRFGGEVPKQFLEISGRTVLTWSVNTAASATDGVVVVLPQQHLAGAEQFLEGVTCVAGGDTRSDSVRAGLAAVPQDAAVVVVHDAARPVASAALYGRAIAAIHHGADAATPVVSVVDTIRTVDGQMVDRDKLRAVQTPQAFRASILRRVHESEPEATDDAGLIAQAAGTVVTVAGERWNIKLTEPADLAVIAGLLNEQIQ